MQFRTKARAVDLLGKGQIADLPTAITELWKNGYDAYADNLTAEIYLQSYKGLNTPLFVMTDDGKGMSRKDIFEKLALALKNNKAPIIWFHCASIGEFEQGRPLMEQLKLKFPNYKILIYLFEYLKSLIHLSHFGDLLNQE